MSNFYKNIEEEGIFPYSFYKTIIALIPKPGKNCRRKLQNTVYCLSDVKILNKILTECIQKHIKVIIFQVRGEQRSEVIILRSSCSELEGEPEKDCSKTMRKLKKTGFREIAGIHQGMNDHFQEEPLSSHACQWVWMWGCSDAAFGGTVYSELRDDHICCF